MLEVEDLAWTPPNSKAPLWEGVTFGLEPGEMVVLEGQSGSGKSTLLRCIVLLEEADGSVRWEGELVARHNIRRFRNRAVYVHQTPVSIASSVEENLAFPRQVGREFGGEAAVMSEEEQRALLAQFGLQEVDFSRRFDEFSVGEQQRLALVRCLTVRPRVLLLDEPTASLDDASALKVEAYIKSKLVEEEGRAVIWVSHGREQRERLGGRSLDMGEWVSASSV